MFFTKRFFSFIVFLPHEKSFIKYSSIIFICHNEIISKPAINCFMKTVHHHHMVAIATYHEQVWSVVNKCLHLYLNQYYHYVLVKDKVPIDPTTDSMNNVFPINQTTDSRVKETLLTTEMKSRSIGLPKPISAYHWTFLH